MPKPKKAIVFGTFDILHPGHLDFFKQAKAIAGVEGKLVVVVARDLNVKQAKGMFPINNENRRLLDVSRQEIVDEALLGEPTDKFRIIAKIRPDIICLGYDQKVPEGFDEWLKKGSMKIEVVRLKPYKDEVFKSSKFRKPA